ncbi:MAG TPA: hypothetical protein VKT32_00530 [Chthonomonadaceae bacterium]|nr:hypothetical protein [Chthonomonadaceae bacterium]
MPAKNNPGWFAPGPDPRRRQFSREECQAGFWAAIDSIAERYPDAYDGASRHMACSFLCAIISRKMAISRQEARERIKAARRRNQGGRP